MEAVTGDCLSLFWGGPGPSCSFSFPVSLDTPILNQGCEGGREQGAAIHIWTILSTGSH